MLLNVPTASYYSGYTFFRDFDIPLRVIHVEESKAYPDHHHEFDELVVICGGTGSHIIGNTEYNIQRGDIFFIRKGCHHQYINPKKLKYINIIFDEKALLDDSVINIIDQIPESGIRLNVINNDILQSIIGRIDKELYYKKTAYTQMARTYLMQLICLIHRAEQDASGSEDSDTKTRIKQIIEYLERENGPQVSIRHLADTAGTCTRNFHRRFRELTGVPPLHFINRLRIEKACELLSNTDISITSISAMVNYTDSNYFARQFRSITGSTPSSYRKSYRQSQNS